jgi:hypothetical protein
MEHNMSTQRSRGLGVEVLELKNKSLLSKWLFKLLNEDGMWQELLHKKYLRSKTLSQVSASPTDSPFWKGLMNVKEEIFSRGSFVVGNGRNTRFWEDIWLGDKSLADEYPSLYNIANHKNVTVENVLASNPLNIGFRRTLNGNKWDRWTHLLHRLILVQLTDSEDSFKWKLNISGVFSVKSMYMDLLNGHTVFLKKYIWKMKVPLKIKIFMWVLHEKVILTQKITWLNVIGRVVLNVVLVIKMRQYNTFLFHALLLR